jgi:hypothetical protein
MNSTVYVGLAVTSHSSGNLNTSVFSNVSVTTPDTTSPTVTINQAAGQVDPANVSPINFTVVFSEPVTDFATGDVTLSGTAAATTATVTGSGTTYNVAVSGMTANGTVIASLLAGVTHDAAGNPSLASTSTDNTVTFATPPDADFDGDGDVDGRDFLAWQRGYGKPAATPADGDADNDKDVDGNDLGIWQDQYGTVGAVTTVALLSEGEGIEAAPAAIAESVSVESPAVANALQPLSAELVDVAMAWDMASRPRQKVHPAPRALAEYVQSDWLRPAVSRAQSMPWHAGSITAKHLVFGRACEHGDDIFDLEGNHTILEQLFGEDEGIAPNGMNIFAND